VLSAKDATRATGWSRFLIPGYRGITQTRTRTGIDNIRAKYQNANRLQATVTLDGIRADGTPGITVQPGSIVQVSAEGARVGRSVLKQRVPIFEERTVDADLIAEGAVNLRDYFQDRGYFEAEVLAPEPELKDGKTRITYQIDPGPKHRLMHVGIEGNHYFDAKTIRERLFVVPASFELRLGRYSEALRKRDEEAIAELYRSNGYRDVKVTSRTEDDYKGKNGDVAAFFTIDEGPQQRVAVLRVEGATKLDLSRTMASLSSQAGQVFSEFNIASDRETIVQQYGSAGFAGVTFEWEATPGTAPNTVDLKFVIGEGEQQTVRDVAVTGYTTTRAKLVQKQIGLKAGDPLSPSAMAETQRRLYDLGIFSRVNMAVQDPDGDEGKRTLLYDLDEASRYSLTTGFGAEFARIGGSTAVTNLSDPGGTPGFSPRVSLDLARLNLFGSGQSVSLQSRLSTFQRRASINYFVPRVFSLAKFDANVSVFYDDTHDVKTFQSKREEFSAQFVEHKSRSVTLFYRFNYRNVGVSNLKIDPLLLPRLAQSVRVGVAAFNLVQDKRDDPTDPHKGVYNTIDVGLAARAFGSQTSFVRILGRNATYYRLGEKLTLARETQFGVQPAFSNTNAGDSSDPIPLPERFYGGGGSGLRAFPENQAGPRDLLTGFPLGGSALFFNNTELRFPLYGSNISGVLFEDAGNIFSSLSRMSFRTGQKSLSDFNYMVHAAGMGVRYRTPVGPLRFDLAYSINPPKYNGFPGSYAQLVTCSAVGAATPCQASLQQISHFQFFFSIGQAF
jgi:outer membrane protein assembly complex protein YaeT